MCLEHNKELQQTTKLLMSTLSETKLSIGGPITIEDGSLSLYKQANKSNENINMTQEYYIKSQVTYQQ